jgi:hypothetical protein
VNAALNEMGEHECVTRAAVLRALASQIDQTNTRGGYPRALWERAEKETLQEILAIMNPLQRALAAKGGSREGEPALPDLPAAS